MAAANRKLDKGPEFSAEERALLKEALNNVQLSGTPGALRRALELIDSILGKIDEDIGEKGSRDD